MRKVLLVGILTFCVCLAAFADQITITTYYPAPYGMYKDLQTETLTVLNDREEILIGADGANPAIELRDRDGTGRSPYIDFSNTSSGDYDMRLVLTGDNALTVTGGTTTFSNNSGNPGVIRTGSIYFCTSY